MTGTVAPFSPMNCSAVLGLRLAGWWLLLPREPTPNYDLAQPTNEALLEFSGCLVGDLRCKYDSQTAV